MAPLPDLGQDPTLQAVDAALVARGNAEAPRPYLGMSEIGRPCERALWYGFRWCTAPAWDAATLKRFEDGHRGEDIQVERLRLVPGIELVTRDPATGDQIACQDIGGHFRGHLDGVIRGLIQAPLTWHVFEHKQVADKKQAALLKTIQEHGEAKALAIWDPAYFCQGVVYMDYLDLPCHYLTCASAGGRHTISVRTNAAPIAARALIAKAKRIITASEPPARLSDRPDFYQCQWCQHQAMCHPSAVPVLPQVSCRTCAHATPELDGDGRLSCARYGIDLSTEIQRRGAECPQHVFIPALLPWPAVDADEQAGSIRYQGGGVNGPGEWSSTAMAANPAMFSDPVVGQIQTTFKARIL